MSDKSKIICKRCLLSEAGQNDLVQTLEELKAAMPENDKTDDEEYRKRLSKCRQCDELVGGTCIKCGCYAEFRALKRKMHCPHEERKW